MTLLLYAMAILGLSAACELSIDVPIERRIAALKKSSAMYKILFITNLPGSKYADNLPNSVNSIKCLQAKS